MLFNQSGHSFILSLIQQVLLSTDFVQGPLMGGRDVSVTTSKSAGVKFNSREVDRP